MGLFDRLYYGKAGKHDYTEMDMPKNRLSLFFLVFKDHFFDLVKINFLQLVFWIPFMLWTYLNLVAVQTIDVAAILEQNADGARIIMNEVFGYASMWLIGLIPCIAITGPSSAGAAYVMRNWARDQHAFLFSDFKDAFKSNWKYALVTSVITSVTPLMAYTAITYYGQMASSNMVMYLPLMVVFSVTLLWTLMLPLLYPMMIGYELSFKHLFKNAMLMASARMPQMVLTRLITLIPVALLVFGVYSGNGYVVMGVCAYYLLFGFALSRLIYASVANDIFDRYLNPHIEGAQVGMGLRPRTEEDMILEGLEDDEEDDEEYEDDGEA